MPKFQKIKLALAFISLFALISLVQTTYSKYNTSAFGDATMSVARWQIAINDQDIIQDSFITNVIVPTIIESDHVKAGVLAPRSTAYFDLVIDYTNVETSFEYTLATSIPQSGSISDLRVTAYSENGGELVAVNGELSNLSGTVLVDEEPRVKTIRVYASWEDFDDETMDNSADTQASIDNKKAILNVLLNFKQLVN